MEWVEKMNRQIIIEKKLLDSAVCADCRVLDGGIHVLLTSKRHGHVGAISHRRPDGEMQTIESPGHKEAVVSNLWARSLCERLHCPVTVCCGIHYDHITREQIGQVLDCTEQMLQELIGSLEMKE